MILLNLLDDGERYRLETTFDENWRWSRRFVDDPDFDNFRRLSMSFDDFWRTIFCQVWMTASGTVWSFLGTKNEFLWPDGFWQVLTEVFEIFLTSSDGFRWVPTAFVEFWRVLKRRKTGLWSENRTFDVFFGEILLTAASGKRRPLLLFWEIYFWWPLVGWGSERSLEDEKLNFDLFRWNFDAKIGLLRWRRTASGTVFVTTVCWRVSIGFDDFETRKTGLLMAINLKRRATIFDGFWRVLKNIFSASFVDERCLVAWSDERFFAFVFGEQFLGDERFLVSWWQKNEFWDLRSFDEPYFWRTLTMAWSFEKRTLGEVRFLLNVEQQMGLFVDDRCETALFTI